MYSMCLWRLGDRLVVVYGMNHMPWTLFLSGSANVGILFGRMLVLGLEQFGRIRTLHTWAKIDLRADNQG